jgi:hypothetical protein
MDFFRVMATRTVIEQKGGTGYFAATEINARDAEGQPAYSWPVS